MEEKRVLLRRGLRSGRAHGRLPEALATLLRGQELDPRSAARRNEVAMCYNWMRQYDKAIAEARKAIELDPNFPQNYVRIGMAQAGKGMYEEAIVELSMAIKSGQQFPGVRGMLGYVYALAGKRTEAQGVLEEMNGLLQGRFGFAFPIARIHAALGEKDQAFEWLRKACDERDSQVIWLKVDPTMDSLRADPRFIRLKDMGLPP